MNKHNKPSDERDAILKYVRRRIKNYQPLTETYAELNRLVLWIQKRIKRTVKPGGVGRK